MTPQEFNQIIEQRIAGYAARVANEERAETARETREANREVIPIGPEHRRAINRKHRESERGRLGRNIQGVRAVIATTEKRLKQAQERLEYLQGLLADREQRLGDIPVKQRSNPTGVMGVSLKPSGRFCAVLHQPGQRRAYCGMWSTIEAAAEAIERKREELNRSNV